MSQTVREVIPTFQDGKDQDGKDVDPRLQRARERARALRGFYIHLSIYLIVNLGIFLLNWALVLAQPGQNWFFYWPLLGWGIAVVINAFAVFVGDRFFGTEWEERKTREYLKEQR